MAQEFIDGKEVARRAGISVQTLRRYIRAGIGPAVIQLPSGHRRFEESDAEVWLEQLRQTGTAKHNKDA